MAQSHGISIKKQFGQHFLRNELVVHHMIDAVSLTQSSSVFEIGCGDGFLTRMILQQPLQRLWIFEIDPQWADYVKNALPDGRMTLFQENILDTDFGMLKPFAPWTLLANLPYQITFPILYRLQQNRDLLAEGVIMVQEEVAQKIVGQKGRGYGFTSLFFQHYFEWKLLDKVPPQAFLPPPKVFSRLLYFKPKTVIDDIPQEEKFWEFIKACFKQPRRTLRNNIKSFLPDATIIPEKYLNLRAQQMDKQQLLDLWNMIKSSK